MNRNNNKTVRAAFARQKKEQVRNREPIPMCPGRGEEVEARGGCQSSIQEEGHNSVVLGRREGDRKGGIRKRMEVGGENGK